MNIACKSQETSICPPVRSFSDPQGARFARSGTATERGVSTPNGPSSTQRCSALLPRHIYQRAQATSCASHARGHDYMHVGMTKSLVRAHVWHMPFLANSGVRDAISRSDVPRASDLYVAGLCERSCAAGSSGERPPSRPLPALPRCQYLQDPDGFLLPSCPFYPNGVYLGYD